MSRVRLGLWGRWAVRLALFFIPAYFLFIPLAEDQKDPTGPSPASLQAGYQTMVALSREGRYVEALAAAEELLPQYENLYGPDSLKTAGHLDYLGEILKTLGRYDKARDYRTRALGIYQVKLPPDSPYIGNSQNALGLLAYFLGDLPRAVEHYQKALEIYKKMGPDNHLYKASAYNNLAEAYRALGDYEKSRDCYEQALAAYRWDPGANQLSIAAVQNNLGLLEAGRGDLDRAERLYREALVVREKQLGPDHPDTAVTLNNLALVYFNRGEYKQAEPLFERALEVHRKLLGPRHPGTTSNFNNLALVKDALGRYREAEALYLEALAARREVLGENHPQTALLMANLAAHAVLIEDYQTAFERLVRVQEMTADLVDQVMGLASDQRKMNFLLTQKADLEALLALTAGHLGRDGRAQALAFDFWLRRKGLVLEAQKRFQEALVSSDSPKVWRTFKQLQEVRSRLSDLAFKGPEQGGAEAYQREIEIWTRGKNTLEEDLGRLSRSFAQDRRLKKADSRSVARALPPDSVLVDFAFIRAFDYHDRTKWLPPGYLAFVLPAGPEAKVRLVDLGPAEPIDRTLSELKESLLDLTPAGVGRADRLSRKLYNLVLAPIKKELTAPTVFISPDGNLNLISFEILTSPEGRRAIEDHTFIYLNTGRDLLGFRDRAAPQNQQSAVLVGAPDFDLEPDQAQVVQRRMGIKSKPAGIGRSRAPALGNLVFTPLPGAGEEIQKVAEVWGRERCRIFTGPEAQEEVLLTKAQSPAILHLATHGFFLSDADYADLMNQGRSINQQNPSPQLHRVNPLLRSGLALSGANITLSGHEAEAGQGILTAEEALGLNLTGTDLVVLSACQTGLGQVQAGQGVYGLRRAFTQAGAQSLIMSMWPVPDQETQEMMVEFYRIMKTGRTSRAQALRQAVLREKEIVEKRYGRDYPLLWGAFVFLGSP